MEAAVSWVGDGFFNMDKCAKPSALHAFPDITITFATPTGAAAMWNKDIDDDGSRDVKVRLAPASPLCPPVQADPWSLGQAIASAGFMRLPHLSPDSFERPGGSGDHTRAPAPARQSGPLPLHMTFFASEKSKP